MGKQLYRWIKDNLFNTWYNAVISVFLLFFLTRVFSSLLSWFFSVGWGVIPQNLKLILTGSYPEMQLWRIWALLIIIGFLAGVSYSLFERFPKTAFLLITVPCALIILKFSSSVRIFLLLVSISQIIGYLLGKYIGGKKSKFIVIIGWILFVPLMYLFVNGITDQNGFLPVVKTNLWGGLMLSLVISITSIILSFILGLFLALGRRSDLPVVRYFCIGVIEVVRGVPLITLLFLGYLVLPLALPRSMSLGVLLRAMTGIILFHAAYMAENIRGGFQGVPRTQFEAAYAMNFSKVQALVLIILPQVLKNIIPVLVNSFTGMVKDTSLVSIIGLLDLVGISTAIAANPRYMKDSQQVLLFLSLIYFILCFSISRTSRKIEASMNTSTTRIKNER